jgi:hypothetical protein
MPTKLQCNVSDDFAKTIDTGFQKAALDQCPDKRPPKLSNLIPHALLHYGRTVLGIEIDPALQSEADEVLVRKPGPRTKKPIESLEIFDERPGMWLSNVAIATGCALVKVDEWNLSLQGCHVPTSAAQRAIEEGWGAIPEEQRKLPGMRFLPPGTEFALKNAPAPAPMALADVGTWIAEDLILKQATLVLADARCVVITDGQRVPEDAFVIPQATPPEPQPIDPSWDEVFLAAHKSAVDAARKQAVLMSIATAEAEIYSLGWTSKREVRNGKPGILLVPPRVKLTYEIAPGQMVPVSK